jgi:Terminase small subunit
VSDELTTKQRAFVEAYLTCWNASQAARMVSPQSKRPNELGRDYLSKPDIQTAIRSRMAEVVMSADEVLARLADHARGSMADFLDDAGNIDLAAARDAGKLHLVKSRSKTKDGERIELYDAQAALEKIGRAHGLFTDNVAVSGELTTKGYTVKEASPDVWDEPTTDNAGA